ncbi:MAG: hypothetical protein H6618_07160 [Deltaproteobacteria bacterium]|nr:hypothetical protein [Deltaproteobacteria bacterium]
MTHMQGEILFLLDHLVGLNHEFICEAILRLLLKEPAKYKDKRPSITEAAVSLSDGKQNFQLCMQQKQIPPESENSLFGTVDIVATSPEAGIYRLMIRPKMTIPCHFHRQMSESELVLSQGLILQGLPVRSGSARTWPAEYCHEYYNPGDETLAVLCIDRPGFIPEDEIICDRPVSGLQDLPPSCIRSYW